MSAARPLLAAVCAIAIGSSWAFAQEPTRGIEASLPDVGAPDASSPVVPPRPASTSPGAEDEQVIEQLELLENLDAASNLDLLVDLDP